MTLTREQQKEVFAHIFHNVFNQTTEKEQAHLERALVAQGINTVYDMLAMSDNAIESVRYVSGGDTINGKTLVLGHQGLIRVFKAFMKTKPVPNGKEAWEDISKDDFDAYRVNPDHFAVAVPTILSGNSAGNAVQSKRTPVDEFKRGIKRDASQFPVFKDEAKWDLFQRSMLATAPSQGVENTLDASYKPTTVDDIALFEEQQKFMYAVLVKSLQTDFGKTCVRKHQEKGNAQLAFKELSEEMNTSTRASMEASNYMSYITSTRIDDGTWKGTATSYILHWQEQNRLYEAITDRKKHLSSELKKTLLENAVHPMEELRRIKISEDEARTRGQTTYSYVQYCTLLRSAAESYDAKHIKPSRTST